MAGVSIRHVFTGWTSAPHHPYVEHLVSAARKLLRRPDLLLLRCLFRLSGSRGRRNLALPLAEIRSTLLRRRATVPATAVETRTASPSPSSAGMGRFIPGLSNPLESGAGLRRFSNHWQCCGPPSAAFSSLL